MKLLIVLLATSLSIPAFASVSAINCRTISEDAIVRISFEKAIDPAHPWIGYPSFSAQVQVQRLHSSQTYTKTVQLTPIESQKPDMRGDVSEGGIYLQLYPQIVADQATGKYTGQLFINDLDQRVYFDFRSEGNTPGLVCK